MMVRKRVLRSCRELLWIRELLLLPSVNVVVVLFCLFLPGGIYERDDDDRQLSGGGVPVL